MHFTSSNLYFSFFVSFDYSSFICCFRNFVRTKGYIQLSKEPNKVGFMSVLQPFGLKLFFKVQMYFYSSNILIYYFSPVFMLSLLFPYVINIYNFGLGLLFYILLY